MYDPTDGHITTYPNGDTGAAAPFRPDGVHSVAILRPDGQTFTVIYLPHGFHGPCLRDVVRELAPGCPLHTSYALASDPDAPAEMLAMWDYVIVFDTTHLAREAGAAA